VVILLLVVVTDETTTGCVYGWVDELDSYTKQGNYAAEMQALSSARYSL